MRQGYYYILAPQSGQIVNISFEGLGEIVKEGQSICTIVPNQNEQVAELFVDPIDLPLIAKGQTVNLQFDGWPAFVLSGWPGVSYGAFESEVVTIDRVISDNGKFRILVRNNSQPWPEALKIGSGVRGFALLKDVPLIYDLWRKLNGFPPEFYQNKSNEKANEKSNGK